LKSLDILTPQTGTEMDSPLKLRPNLFTAEIQEFCSTQQDYNTRN